jgi:hypothetical protein
VFVFFSFFVSFLFILYSLSSSCPIVCWIVHVLFTLFVAFLFIVYSLSSLCSIVCWRVHVLFTLFVAFLFIVYSLSSSCPIVCRRVHVLFTLFVFIVHSGDLLCCVFVSCVFVLCTVCSQFLWIVHFRLSILDCPTPSLFCNIYLHISDLYIIATVDKDKGYRLW